MRRETRSDIQLRCVARLAGRAWLLGGFILAGVPVQAQELTGSLIGKVLDEQGGAVKGAELRVTSPARIGAAALQSADDRGQWRFSALPAGVYTLDVNAPGMQALHDEGIRINAGATISRTIQMKVAGVEESIVVEGAGSRIEARDPGFTTRFGYDDIRAIPTRRASMFDFLRAAPGVSPTSPSSGTSTTMSAFGSGTNENQFLIDGTNTTCPCTGVARSEPGIDFIQEVQLQSVGASAEFGNMQGAVVNVIMRQGGARLFYDGSVYVQPAALTSAPVQLPVFGSGGARSGYSRDLFLDATANAGGPAIRDRLWFFGGYQNVRDYDSQAGTDPLFQRKYRQQKVMAKLTWLLAPGWQLMQSFHGERGAAPDRPTIAIPFEATTRQKVSAPAFTVGNLTHTASNNTVWDMRIGRFSHTRDDGPASNNLAVPSRFDRLTGITSGAPPRIGNVTITRATAKATLTRFQPDLLGAEHQWKAGVQFERGEHHAIHMIPTNTRYEDRGGALFQSISTVPAHIGGAAMTVSAFATDAITLSDRITINAGVRFDRSRAISQDLFAVDLEGHQTGNTVEGAGTFYTWNLWSPRLGVTAKLTGNGRTMLRGSYGRFIQGVLTGELEAFHPGASAVRTVGYDSATRLYTVNPRVVDPKINLQIDRDTRAPRTDEYSAGIDRAVGRDVSVAVAFIHKRGANFIGWTDTAGRYVEGALTLADGRSIPVQRLDTAVTPPGARRFLLTNDDRYSLRYNGLVLALEKRRSHRWQAFGSYTRSRASGLLPSSGASASGAQVSTVSPPQPLIFGRDPNDFTNAEGLLPNDRPHMLRAMFSAEVPRTGLVVAANVQYFSGKPWTAAAQTTTLPQGELRILLEPRGSHRLSSQSLLDVRLSRAFRTRGAGRIELLLDVLNALNDTAEESLVSEVQMTEAAISPTFGKPASFIDPRRVMLGVRMNFGK
ncbi:MAG: TonB-dependent receptor [Vicinamibacterales bacterium]